MPRYGRAAVGLAAVALLSSLVGAAPTAAAPATSLTPSVLTYDSAGGTDVSVGDVLEASLKTGTDATFYLSSAGSLGVKCASSNFHATVLTNPTAPGTATERLSEQGFDNCTTNVLGTIAVNSVAVDNLPYLAAVTSAGTVTLTGDSAGPIQSTVKLRTLLGTITCVYRASGNTLVGAASNATTSITFTSQHFTKHAGPGLCFRAAYFSATYAPVRDTSVPNSPITYVN
ncbi:Tat pathway signal sequence domain protein [Micromonospora sp. WMMA1363]|uniref:Tat pathway signal sequence domain protein n=1 Tax=Micromonospora sp. WMMA1363 TaxID=3053985 RepID=UPI00259C8DC1|nr:Tat pathway signal sequence domain protein [Micromonospora sp. WMMA1363]MDM4718704.1 Tat pathway signal sequence domain protein [Micromonospora sp. WMMA1363]